MFRIYFTSVKGSFIVTVSEHNICIKVGHGTTDHNYWGRPEDMPNDMYRPSFTITGTSSNGGADLAGETAAAFAAGYLVFKDVGKDTFSIFRNLPVICNTYISMTFEKKVQVILSVGNLK